MNKHTLTVITTLLFDLFYSDMRLPSISFKMLTSTLEEVNQVNLGDIIELQINMFPADGENNVYGLYDALAKHYNFYFFSL